MNAKQAKAVRKIARKQKLKSWKELMLDIRKERFKTRLWFAWYILKGDRNG